MFRSRPFLLFILILVLGLMIEGLKSFNELRAPKGNKLGSAIGALDMTPFRVSDKMMRDERARLIQGQKLQQRQAGFRLAGRAQKGEKYDFSEGHKVAEKAKDVATETEVDKTKKKKKKKKLARKKADDQKSAEYKTDIAKNTSGATSATTETPASGSAYVAPQEQSKLPVTYEDWANLVLGSPQPENVLKLVEYYQSNMVTGDVFYAITAAMVQDSNPKQQELGIYAVRQIHTLRSFEFFVDVLKSEQQGSNLAGKTGDALSDYQDLNHVGVLKSVLSTHASDMAYVQLAVNLIDNSTRTQIELRNSREPSAAELENPEQAAARLARRQAKLAQIYRGFVPLLESVITAYTGRTEITLPAQNALTRIRNLTVVGEETNG